MAILRSVDGKFYEVPDEDLSKHELAPEKVSELMAQRGPSGGGRIGPGGPGPGGDVDPYYYCWRNWRNCYCWRNCY